MSCFGQKATKNLDAQIDQPYAGLSYIVDPYSYTNLAVYHVSQSVQSTGRSLIYILIQEILIHKYLDEKSVSSPSQVRGFSKLK